jgi:hypothetical protein
VSTESATYIADLNSSLPAGGTSPISADDHLRLLKSVSKASFPNVSGAVTATHTELNIMDGVTASTAELNVMDGVTVTAAEIEYADALTSAVQTQIAAKRNALTVQVKTSSFTAAVGYMYVIRAAFSNAEATLPASPSAGDMIVFVDHAAATGSGYSGYIRPTIKLNGTTYASLYNLSDRVTKLVYVDSTTGWAKYDAAA